MALLPDPAPPGAPAGQWWPPQMLDAGWITAHAAEIDVVHLHFGAESFTPAHVAAAVDAAHAAGLPFVFTVHDLENPQLSDQTSHRLILDALIPRADALITLTRSAADEIRRTWGRDAHVIAHPPILDGPEAVATASARRGLRIGVHLRDLRPNIDAIGAVTTLAGAATILRGRGIETTGVVHLNERVRDERTAQLLRQLAAENDALELHRHPRLSDDELAASLSRLDVCVLPYAHGTHSGWLELCYDLAVPVAGTAAGHFAAQHPGDYARYEIGDPLSLAAAIENAARPAWSHAGSSARAAERERRRERRGGELARIRAAHEGLYHRLTAREEAA